MIIGLMGQIGAGKGEVSIILEKNGFEVVVFGDVVREEVISEGLEPNRENTDKISKLRTGDNPNYWRERVYEKIKNLEKAVVDGIRYPEDAEFFKEKLGDKFILLFVTAPTETRFMRLNKRNRVGDPQTIEHFKSQEEKQEELFNVSKTLGMADLTIDNIGTKEELEAKVNEFLSSNT